MPEDTDSFTIPEIQDSLFKSMKMSKDEAKAICLEMNKADIKTIDDLFPDGKPLYGYIEEALKEADEPLRIKKVMVLIGGLYMEEIPTIYHIFMDSLTIFHRVVEIFFE